MSVALTVEAYLFNVGVGGELCEVRLSKPEPDYMCMSLDEATFALRGGCGRARPARGAAGVHTAGGGSVSNSTGKPCTVKLVCGNPCVCNDVPGHPHMLHVCNDKDCQCHAAAYHMEEVVTRNGDRLYIPQGARLAPRKRGGE